MYLKSSCRIEIRKQHRAFVSDLLPGVGVDVAHHEVDLLLCILSEVSSFWDDLADQFMVVFATPFLVRGTGIAVKQFCPEVPPRILFDCRWV